jgi:tetratricopeptide (TPR) repeat protein
MKILALTLLTLSAFPAVAQMPIDHSMADHPMPSAGPALSEKLGVVSFPVSCLPSTQAPFNRGVALLHDFWYSEAQRQFEAIIKADPTCPMAHWGLAMSKFHQIWNRPGEETMKSAWAEMEKAQTPAAETEGERAYIAALTRFFRPGKEDFQARIDAYSIAMGKLYQRYPDVDAGAFYALSLLAAESPDDTSLTNERKAMVVLVPLFAKYPDNPGVVHYIIHSCDNPAMASEALAASDHYGGIAPAGAHAVHMPGHIYARLGMWPQDVTSQLESIAAAENAEKRGEGGIMDEPHSYDFVTYAYIQSGQDAHSKEAMNNLSAVLTRIEAMPKMANQHMEGMVPYYRAKLPTFYALEMRDWKTAAALEPAAGATPEIETMTYWARTVGAGRLRDAAQASADLARYDSLIEEVKKGKRAYMAEGTGVQIERDEMVAWVHYAKGMNDGAIQHMREAADLQDKVGQAEVDIPAREMLADMLLELHQPQQALTEYEVALKLSPNRFNGLYHAGLAAEEAGDKAKAQQFYAALLKSTDNGAESSRPEMAHVKSFVSSTQVAAK